MLQILVLLQSKAADVLELNEVHRRYMTLVQHVCLLSPSSKELRVILEPMLQSVTDFANIVRYADQSGSMQAISAVCVWWSGCRRAD